jgi:hypothetical protein
LVLVYLLLYLPLLAQLKAIKLLFVAVATNCTRPNEPPPLSLIRFDYFENIGKLSHFGTTDKEESRKVRHSGSFVPIKSLLFVNKPTALTKELGTVLLSVLYFHYSVHLCLWTHEGRIGIHGNSFMCAEIFKAAPPLRSRFKPAGCSNKRDVARWLPAQTINAFVGAPGNVGAVDYHIEWTDGPDRYTLNSSLDPRAGWRR